MSKSVIAITSTRFLAGFLKRCFATRADVAFHDAENVENGLKLAAQLRPDFAIVDAATAGERLPQLCGALMKRVAAPPIVLCAPSSNAAELLSATHLACQGKLVVIEKPFTAKAIVEAVIGRSAESAEPGAPDKFAWMKTEPGVLGYVCIQSNGTTVSSGGGGDTALGKAMNTVLDIATDLGEKLGMDRLVSIKFYGTATRCLVEKRADAMLAVATTPKTDLQAISRNLRQTDD